MKSVKFIIRSIVTKKQWAHDEMWVELIIQAVYQQTFKWVEFNYIKDFCANPKRNEFTFSSPYNWNFSFHFQRGQYYWYIFDIQRTCTCINTIMRYCKQKIVFRFVKILTCISCCNKYFKVFICLKFPWPTNWQTLGPVLLPLSSFLYKKKSAFMNTKWQT